MRWLSIWLALLTVVTAMPLSWAQGPMQMPKTRVYSTGKIKAVRNGVFHVANSDGDQLLLAVEPNAEEVVVSGSAKPEWLRPGMAVSFQSRFFKNKDGLPQGEAIEPIAELKVFTPRADSKSGIKEVKRSSLLTADEEPERKAAIEVVPFSVVGLLTKQRGGRVTVAVGKTFVQAPLANDTKIDVDLADLRLAREGDDIEYEGWHYVGQEDRIHATKVWISIARALGEEKAKPVAKQDSKQVAKQQPPVASGAEASGDQRAAARQIQLAIARAKREYATDNVKQAVKIVELTIEQWNSFLKSDETVAPRLLHPLHKQLAQVHSFLEIEGCKLPTLPELPKLDEVVAP